MCSGKLLDVNVRDLDQLLKRRDRLDGKHKRCGRKDDRNGIEPRQIADVLMSERRSRQIRGTLVDPLLDRSPIRVRVLLAFSPMPEEVVQVRQEGRDDEKKKGCLTSTFT